LKPSPRNPKRISKLFEPVKYQVSKDGKGELEEEEFPDPNRKPSGVTGLTE